MVKMSALDKDKVKDLITNIHRKTRVQLFLFGISFVIGISLKMSGIQFPRIVLEILTLLFFTNVIYDYLARKLWSDQTVSQISKGYLIFQIIEFITLLVALHFIGAVLFWGIAILMAYVVFCFLVFTQRIYSWAIVFLSLVGYLILGWLENSGILQYVDLYNLGINPYQNLSSFISTISLITGLIISLGFYLDSFLGMWQDDFKVLQSELNRLRGSEEELSKAKAALEERIEAREREVRELTHQLDGQLKLREEESQKLKHLEKFHELAIDRELKMRELKEKIKKLESRSKSKQDK